MTFVAEEAALERIGETRARLFIVLGYLPFVWTPNRAGRVLDAVHYKHRPPRTIFEKP